MSDYEESWLKNQPLDCPHDCVESYFLSGGRLAPMRLYRDDTGIHVCPIHGTPNLIGVRIGKDA